MVAGLLLSSVVRAAEAVDTAPDRRAAALECAAVALAAPVPRRSSEMLEFAEAACVVAGALARAGLEDEVRPLVPHLATYVSSDVRPLAAAAVKALARVRESLPGLARDLDP